MGGMHAGQHYNKATENRYALTKVSQLELILTAIQTDSELFVPSGLDIRAESAKIGLRRFVTEAQEEGI